MAGKDTTQNLRLWNVQFVDDYAVITATSVEGLDEDDAVFKATNMLANYYGINVGGWMLNDVEELG